MAVHPHPNSLATISVAYHATRTCIVPLIVADAGLVAKSGRTFTMNPA